MEFQQQIDFNRERTTKEIFSDFWLFLQNEWKQLVIVLSIGVVPFALIGVYFMNKAIPFLFEGSEMGNDVYVALLFSLLAKYCGVLLSTMYVHSYIENKSITINSALDYIRETWWPALKATILMLFLVMLGFSLFVVPGFLVFPIALLIVFDVLFCNQLPSVSLLRCFTLVKTNWKQAFATVYLTYAAIIFLTILFSNLIPEGNMVAGFVVNAVTTVIGEFSSTIFILLYFSLANQNKRL